jgi:hypothetical protein
MSALLFSNNDNAHYSENYREYLFTVYYHYVTIRKLLLVNLFNVSDYNNISS